jgi:O-antigen/teichoic acid export membrane protein
MNQTKLGSFIETMINIMIGFVINFVANLIILPLFGFESLTLATNFEIGLLYTVISVIRSYVIRRWFNARLHAAAMALAGKERAIVNRRASARI